MKKKYEVKKTKQEEKGGRVGAEEMRVKGEDEWKMKRKQRMRGSVWKIKRKEQGK